MLKQLFIIGILAVSNVSTFADTEFSGRDIKILKLIKQKVDSINAKIIKQASINSAEPNSDLLSYTIYDLADVSRTQKKTPQKVVVIDQPDSELDPVIVKGIPTIGVISKFRLQEVFNRLTLGVENGQKKANFSWTPVLGIRLFTVAGLFSAAGALIFDYNHWCDRAKNCTLEIYFSHLTQIFKPRKTIEDHVAGVLRDFTQIRGKDEVVDNLCIGGIGGALAGVFIQYILQVLTKGAIGSGASLADGVWFASTTFPLPTDNPEYLIVMTDKQKRELVTNKLKRLNYYELYNSKDPLLSL
jgi:hypothetical protein